MPRVQKKRKLVLEGMCPGSYHYRNTYKGRKIKNGVVRYPCPQCDKHVACDKSGNFLKHGGKYMEPLSSKERGKFSFCAECGMTFEGTDFLCRICRA